MIRFFIALFLFTAVPDVEAAPQVVVDAVTETQPNIFDKFLQTIKDFAKKIDATENLDEFRAYCLEFGKFAGEFKEKNAAEIKATTATLSEEQQSEYEKEIELAVKELERSIANTAAKFVPR